MMTLFFTDGGYISRSHRKVLMVLKMESYIGFMYISSV